MSSAEKGRSAAAMQGLLRYLSAGRAGIVEASASGGGATVALQREGEGMRRFGEGLLRDAAARGLVVRQGRIVSLEAAGRAWLKRSMCESDPFAAQHGDRERRREEVEGECLEVVVNLAESPLAGLARLRRKDGSPFLDAPLVAAGERLRVDFTRGQLQPRVSANWEATVSRGRARGASGVCDLGDAALGARMRVERALKAVGPDLSGVLVDVCCFLKGLETVERERDWPVRSGKLMLRTALSALDRHYRPREAERQGEPRRHRWGAADYRPSLGRT